MDEVANGLHSCPSSGSGAEGLPGEVKQLAVDFTVTARQEKRQGFQRQFANVVLRRVRYVGIECARVANDCVVEKTYDT